MSVFRRCGPRRRGFEIHESFSTREVQGDGSQGPKRGPGRGGARNRTPSCGFMPSWRNTPSRGDWRSDPSGDEAPIATSPEPLQLPGRIAAVRCVPLTTLSPGLIGFWKLGLCREQREQHTTIRISRCATVDGECMHADGFVDVSWTTVCGRLSCEVRLCHVNASLVNSSQINSVFGIPFYWYYVVWKSDVSPRDSSELVDS